MIKVLALTFIVMNIETKLANFSAMKWFNN